ncbi:hypothetical protein [Streptosporangium sp. NPDC049304]|uniref:hypothetical protein n=1 Tax=Streptosporangium sp. NPDC049304 TaxID=3154830 RepID=UPI003447476C
MDPRGVEAMGLGVFRSGPLNATSSSVLIYAALDGRRRHMVEHGHDVHERPLPSTHRPRTEIDDVYGTL